MLLFSIPRSRVCYYRFKVLQAEIPGGDPTILGWVTFGLYMMAAALTLQESKTGQKPPQNIPIQRAFKSLAILQFILGLNKQLDLQTSLIILGRYVADQAGLHNYYRQIQLFFFVGLLVGSTVAVAVNFKMLRAFWSAHPWVATGFGLVITYALIRAGSIDHVDQMLV